MHDREHKKVEGHLFLSSGLLLDVANSSPERGIIFLTRPVVLGLGHPVSSVGGVVPAILKVGSTGKVELGVVEELSGLVHIPLVVGSLLGLFIGTDLFVLCLGQAQWDVRPLCKLTNFDVLFVAGSVFVGVLDGFPEIQVGDLSEDGLVQLGGLGGLGGGDESRGGGHGGSDEDGGDLHGYFVGVDKHVDYADSGNRSNLTCLFGVNT